MKQLALLLIAAMTLVGCGKKTTPSEPETKAQPKMGLTPGQYRK
jgi:PBP1b-binding outer membrane lipoprotein LpoB